MNRQTSASPCRAARSERFKTGDVGGDDVGQLVLHVLGDDLDLLGRGVVLLLLGQRHRVLTPHRTVTAM